MDKISIINQNINIQLNYPDLALNLVIAAILALILERVFISYSQTINNKKIFSKNFILIATTTAFIISIVKSSLALSLGLVGALSIIRFRTAIKEPEEISYLFICIGIGLGLGAGYKLITIMGIGIIISLILIKEKIFKNKEVANESIYLTLNLKGKLDTNQILNICKENCSSVYLRDFDLLAESSQIGLIVNFDDENKINKIIEEIRLVNSKIEINLINKHDII
ncbi:DUF4956 domain-containing protein [Candidatus Pelagibacter ubique]|jgi:hypothetical protein|nr:DUF4956 domain-containing protein [Candidatus Pelagibacter ubique]